MVEVGKVKIFGKLAGAVLWHSKLGYASFEYDTAFLQSGLDISPIKMPLQKAQTKNIFSFPNLPPETFKGLPGLLADSLPDRFGNKLIDAWLAKQGRNPDSVNPVERLCYTGTRGMGALEFEPSVEAFNHPTSVLDVEDLVSLANKILNARKTLKSNISKNAEQGLMNIISVGTSAGGARPKAVIAYNEKTGEVRSGQVAAGEKFSYWIIKFDGVANKQLGDPKGYGKIEMAYYKMAIDCGIEMSECRLMKENGRAHFMTKRFDRIGNEKLHLQTLCGIAHYDYNDPNSYSYEQAFQVMRLLRLPYTDAVQLYMRMVFNVVARNQDDHTKNISFLMNKQGEWKLSPAYDVTYACDPKSKWMNRHQLSINGKREEFTRQDLLAVAKEMNIKKPDAIIDKVIRSVKKWQKFAASTGVLVSQIKAIGKTHLVKI